MQVHIPKHHVKNIYYSDAIMGAMIFQITSLTIVYSTAYSGADHRKYKSSVSPAFVQETHQWPVNSLHKWPVTQKMFPFDDVIMFQVIGKYTCMGLLHKYLILQIALPASYQT